MSVVVTFTVTTESSGCLKSYLFWEFNFLLFSRIQLNLYFLYFQLLSPFQVTSSGNTSHCSLSKLSSHPIGKLLQYTFTHTINITVSPCVVCRVLTALVQVLPTAEARDVLLHHYQYSHGVSHGLQWSAFQLWLTTMMGVSSYPSNTSQSADNAQVVMWI